MAVHWDVTGGNGGSEGGHGDGGDGGEGGSGGASHTWSEDIKIDVRYQDGSHSHTDTKTIHHTRPAGHGGAGGQGGTCHGDSLSPGRDGPPGFGEITVISRDGGAIMYPSRYNLVVTEFEVIDENDDGINEPGEHLIISNIVVSNTGGMPSPKTGKLQVLVQRSKWLEPIFVPLDLPGEIAPGETVQVDGTLRAFIKNETASRALGTLLHAKDTVSLRTYSERLQRDVPEFNGEVAVVYEYPLLMTAPKFLDCVAKGDMVTFSWTIQNISTKEHGRLSVIGRETGTHLSDPGGMFELQRASYETPHDLVDMIDVLEPGETMPITVEFRVSDLVDDFTTGSMLINLMLADPSTHALRSVVSFDLRIQVSPSYRYNPDAHFLLVINAQSPNAFVLQILHFIEYGLRLDVDVFNLSLNGAFVATDEKGEEYAVLSNYTGKSVIILGNTMNYFQNGVREPWELLDVGQAFSLACHGTGFLVVAPSNKDSLKGFAHLLSIPSSAIGEVSPPTPCTDVKDALKKLVAATDSSTPSRLTLPIKKKVLQKLDKTIASKAKAVHQSLQKAFPLRRFVVAPDENVDPKQGVLNIIEGLSHGAHLVASMQEYSKAPILSEYHIVMFAHLLPFKDRCAMFWNLVRLPAVDEDAGVDAAIVYAGSQLTPTTSRSDAEEEHLVSGKACSAIAWSISTQLASEVTRFTAGSGSGSPSLLPQLPLLRQFVASAPKALLPADATLAPLLHILGHLRGVTSSLTFGQSFGQNLTGPGKRRKKVRAVVLAQVSEPLVKLCVVPVVEKAVKGSKVTKVKGPAALVADGEAATKKRLVQLKKANPGLGRVGNVEEFAFGTLEGLTMTTGARFWDLVNGKAGSAVVMGKEEFGKLKVQQMHRQVRLAEDVEFSSERLRNMITKVPLVEVSGVANSPAEVDGLDELDELTLENVDQIRGVGFAVGEVDAILGGKLASAVVVDEIRVMV
ncbi:hypothetical protein B0T25DRAFT_553663 [Lasiosphaeria hispida]|uniref:DUF7932 domain-containing protein n=1 Tax=Lasiosphaeria hispida TaxID=260671 RepID=A0AAJ0HCL6_9PEZI|nr:hypothetical protein B0T25DRAFT_553663 [Lasiosphaeria hispida]